MNDSIAPENNCSSSASSSNLLCFFEDASLLRALNSQPVAKSAFSGVLQNLIEAELFLSDECEEAEEI